MTDTIFYALARAKVTFQARTLHTLLTAEPYTKGKKMKSKLCIYHGNCADGFTAAWVVRKKFGEDDVEFVAGVYGNPPPDVTDRDVIVVDFSYSRAAMEGIVARARSVLVLDHHKTARDALADLAGATVVFDMERSGAGIAWDHFFPGQPRPRLVDHVEDRDLWRFKFPETREVQAAVFSFEYTFENWDFLEACDPTALAIDGRAIERKHFKDIRELCAVVTRPMEIGGHVVPVANLPYTFTADAGHHLADGAPFAACYWDTPTGRVFSLRSREGGADVSLIAKAYGGGGHANASGFRVPWGHELAQGDATTARCPSCGWLFGDHSSSDEFLVCPNEAPEKLWESIGLAFDEMPEELAEKPLAEAVSIVVKAFRESNAEAESLRARPGTDAGGTNYVADREVNPTQIKFANGRRVWVNADGGLDTDFGPLTP